jgi:hypothetical protein
MTETNVDYAATRTALRNREEKARKLARAAWNMGLSSTDIPDLDSTGRRKLARIAAVNPPKAESPTWTSVLALLVRMETYAHQNPDHEAAVRADPDLRTVLLPGVVPKGWAEVVALGPVAGAVCQIGDCRRPAVRRCLHNSRDTWRCAVHPPVGSDWGSQLDWTPKGCNQPLRCYCGRCAGEPGSAIALIPEPRKEAP